MSALTKAATPRVQPPVNEIVRVVTVAEAALALRLSHATVRRMIATGQLKAKRCGRAFRIVLSDLTSFLQTH